MILYYTPGTCALAPHIALYRTGATFSIERVDLRTRQTDQGRDFRSVNPSGKVPVLRLDSGELLTETIAILLYIADRAPGAALAAPEGGLDRLRLINCLSFIATEMHKSFIPLFSRTAGAETRAEANRAVRIHLAVLEQELSVKRFYFGDRFTVADAYVFSILGWPTRVGIDLSEYPALSDYRVRIDGERGVSDATRAESFE